MISASGDLKSGSPASALSLAHLNQSCNSAAGIWHPFSFCTHRSSRSMNSRIRLARCAASRSSLRCRQRAASIRRKRSCSARCASSSARRSSSSFERAPLSVAPSLLNRFHDPGRDLECQLAGRFQIGLRRCARVPTPFLWRQGNLYLLVTLRQLEIQPLLFNFEVSLVKVLAVCFPK